LVLDLDDTLYPESSYVRSGFWAVARWLEQEAGIPSPDTFSCLWGAHLRGERGHVFDDFLGLRPELSGVEVGSLVDCYRNHAPEISFYPGMKDFIDLAVAKGLRLALISDGPLAAQTWKVEALGLSRWFDPVILTDRWGRAFWKPHPRAFQLVEQGLGCSGPSMAYVGDNPEKDFQAPNHLGWTTLRLRLPGQLRTNLEPAGAEASTRLEFRSIKELCNWVESLPPAHG
jgi:putative hydrolase of the HAD superfamily